MIKYWIILVVFCCIVSCLQKEQEKKDYPVLQVDLTVQQNVSVFDIFHDIELIPLETNDLCLIKRIDKVEVYDGKYYVFDKTRFIIFVFDQNGKFLTQIGRIGQGPGEYAMGYDFQINRKDNTVQILNPAKFIYTYDLDGRFLHQIRFEGLMTNFQRFEYVDSCFVFWGVAKSTENQVNVFTKDGSHVNGFFKDWYSLDFWSNNVLYSYNGNTYFYKPHYHEIMKVSRDSLNIAYQWDFGNKALNIKKFDLLLNDDRQYTTIIKMAEKQISGEVPYCMNKQAQTDMYYYAQIMMNAKTPVNLFYSKATHKYRLFDKTIENVRIFPLYFSNDFIIGAYPDKEVFKNILDEDNIQKLHSIKEDDNPCLIKYSFKR